MALHSSSSMKVLRAISSPMRMQILTLLYNGGPLSYMEIMKGLRLSPDKDAGRFAYHLKKLLQANLIQTDSNNGNYVITDLGRLVVNMAQGVGEKVSRRRRMHVRTSHLTIEEFDRNKIVDSLVREAGVPLEMACHIAREAEERLLMFRTKYLTAPLIRELVNAILLEKGLEEYRHKLTRLGLPVYDVTKLVQTMGAHSMGVGAVYKVAGDRVMGEYALLNVLHRDIADAHLSGILHIGDIGSWTLKIGELVHDLRFYLSNGTRFSGVDMGGAPLPPPKSFEAALLLCLSVVRTSATEVSGEQTLDFFNVFLAPFAEGRRKDEVKEALHHFILDLNHSPRVDGSLIGVTLGLELQIPSFLAEVDAVGAGGEKAGTYGEFGDEAQTIADALLEIMLERGKPLFNPSVVVKLRGASRSLQRSDALLLAHRMASKHGTPLFALLPEDLPASYSATGFRTFPGWTEDWELDTLRMANLDGVTLNLPRIAYDADGDVERFFRLLEERGELALRALLVKRRTLASLASQGLFPILTQDVDGEGYIRLSDSPCTLGFVGLNEAVEALTGSQIHEGGEGEELAVKVLSHLAREAAECSRRARARVTLWMNPDVDAAVRLARLDAEKYGWSKIHAQGGKEQPYYTYMTATPLNVDIPWRRRMELEGAFHALTPGGHLAPLQLADVEQDPEALAAATRWIARKTTVGLLAYARNLTYCSRCKETYYGLLLKCPRCGLVNPVIRFSRVAAKYQPSTRWRLLEGAVKGRIQYSLGREG